MAKPHNNIFFDVYADAQSELITILLCYAALLLYLPYSVTIVQFHIFLPTKTFHLVKLGLIFVSAVEHKADCLHFSGTITL